VDWPTISPQLVALFHSLASNDITQPLADGHVEWMNRSISFIGPDTMTGIYLKVTGSKTYTRPARVWYTDGTGALRQSLIERGRLTMQVQAKSLEDTNFSLALHWLENIRRNLWEVNVISYLKVLGLAVQTTSEITNHDAPIDDRMASIATLDIFLSYVDQPVLPISYVWIEHIGGVAHVAGSATIAETPFEADKPT
jgi:hypothetical protein